MPKCERCGADRSFLYKHHVKPRIMGGTDDDGVEHICGNCHDDEHGGPCGGAIRGGYGLGNTPEARKKAAASQRRHYAEHPDRLMARQQKIRAIKKGGDPNRWANKWDACVSCGTTEVEHMGRGLCSNCYMREKRLHGEPTTWPEGTICAECGGTDRPPMARGLCTRCYSRAVYRMKHDLPLSEAASAAFA